MKLYAKYVHYVRKDEDGAYIHLKNGDKDWSRIYVLAGEDEDKLRNEIYEDMKLEGESKRDFYRRTRLFPRIDYKAVFDTDMFNTRITVKGKMCVFPDFMYGFAQVMDKERRNSL